MVGTTDYKLNVETDTLVSEVNIANSMSPGTAAKMVQMVRAAPTNSGVFWTPKMSLEVGFWSKKAKAANIDHVRPPRAVRQMLADDPFRRESTIIRSLTPVLDKEHEFNRYVELLKQKVPNWQELVLPFFDVHDELQEQLRTERAERSRRRTVAGLNENGENAEDAEDAEVAEDAEFAEDAEGAQDGEDGVDGDYNGTETPRSEPRRGG
jgi:hypothetical protein